jgi:hypothetical protein
MRAGDLGVTVTAVFSVGGEDEDQAYAVVAELIDQLNAVANMPQCECDLDVSVERTHAHAQGSG